MSKLKAWFSHVASLPCLRCGRQGVQLNHIESFLSNKTGLTLGKRKGLALAAVIPLCPWCHTDAPDAFHKVKQEVFFAAMDKTETWVHQWLATELAVFLFGNE